MTQPQIAPGVYTYYIGNENESNQLYCLYFDGQTMGDPVACTIGMPNLKESPCVLYDRDGAYANDGVPRIHIFVLDENNTVSWLTTCNGFSFGEAYTVNIATQNRFGALLLSDGIHLYYSDTGTNRITHACSTTDWAFGSAEPLLTDQQTAAWGVAAVMGYVPYILFGNGSSSQPSKPQNSLQLYYFHGNGVWDDNSPDLQGFNIQLYDTPAATLLGDNIFVPYKGTGGGGQQAYYTTMSILQGTWTNWAQIPGVQTTNSLGCCVYGGRIFCPFQSNGGNNMWTQLYIGNTWLPGAIEIAGPPPRVFWGPAAVAVERGVPAV